MRTLSTLTFNLNNAPVRRETLHGRQYIVAPMAMLTEGVHNGSGGPLLYREAECKKAVAAWNMKPIVVYHPAINGQGVSACDPDILEKQQVGMVMNARWAGGKLRADAWIEEDRANVVDNRITDAIDGNKMMEVSTGLFTDNVGSGGEWGGKAYNAEATNHQPDHLAILPDQIGACSIADGAGLLQLNALSHGDLHKRLTDALRERYGVSDVEGPWITDVFDGYVIYDDMGGKLYKQTYTNTKDKVELTGDSYEVTRVIDYKPAKDGPLGNAAVVDMAAMKIRGLIRNFNLSMTEMKVRGIIRNYSPSQPRQPDGKFGVGGGMGGGGGAGGGGGGGNDPEAGLKKTMADAMDHSLSMGNGDDANVDAIEASSIDINRGQAQKFYDARIKGKDMAAHSVAAGHTKVTPAVKKEMTAGLHLARKNGLGDDGTLDHIKAFGNVSHRQASDFYKSQLKK